MSRGTEEGVIDCRRVNGFKMGCDVTYGEVGAQAVSASTVWLKIRRAAGPRQASAPVSELSKQRAVQLIINILCRV